MKTDMVQSIILTYLKNLPPGLHIRRRIARQRKLTALLSSTEKQASAVQIKFRIFCFDITKSHNKLFLVIGVLAFQPQGQPMKCRIKLIPNFSIFAEIHLQLSLETFSCPFNRYLYWANRECTLSRLSRYISELYFQLYGLSLNICKNTNIVYPNRRRCR